MGFTLGLGVLTYGATWPDAVATARLADGLGYDQVFTADHLFATGGDPGQSFFEGWTALAAWAQTTERVELGLLVGGNPFRNPGVVAKMAATLDHISDGRAILGLGAAWDDEEMVAHGIDTGRSLGQRIDWLDESLTSSGPCSPARKSPGTATPTTSPRSATRRPRSASRCR